MAIARRELNSGLLLLLALAGFLTAAMLLGLACARYAGLTASSDETAGAAMLGLALLAFVFSAGLAAGARKIRASGRRIDPGDAAHYDALADATGDLVLRLDSSASALSISRGAPNLFGVDSAELTGRDFFDRVHVGDRPSLLQAIGAALRSEGAICAALRLRTGSRADPIKEFDEPVFSRAEMRIHRLAGAPAHADDASRGAVI